MQYTEIYRCAECDAHFVYNHTTCTYDLVGGPRVSWNELASAVQIKRIALEKAMENAKDPDAKGRSLPFLVKESLGRSVNTAKLALAQASKALIDYKPDKNEKKTDAITRAIQIAYLNK